jgi:hypothetical protein
MSRLSRVPSLLLAGVALLSISAPLAHACSLVRPWEYRRPRRIEFEATPIHDTVLAGAGDMQFVQAPGHFGPGTARAIYGQRVRVNRLTARARAALPEGVREVLLVPWDYGADCRPVPWSRSAGWLPDTLTGVFAATLRAREHWAGDLPTLDITPFAQPYREPPADTTVRDWLPTRRLGIDRLLRLYDELWPLDTPLDTVTALAYAERLRADTSLAGRYPVERVRARRPVHVQRGAATCRAESGERHVPARGVAERRTAAHAVPACGGDADVTRVRSSRCWRHRTRATHADVLHDDRDHRRAS